MSSNNQNINNTDKQNVNDKEVNANRAQYGNEAHKDKPFPQHYDNSHFTNLNYYKDIKNEINNDIDRMEGEGPTSNNTKNSENMKDF